MELERGKESMFHRLYLQAQLCPMHVLCTDQHIIMIQWIYLNSRLLISAKVVHEDFRLLVFQTIVLMAIRNTFANQG